MLKKTYLSRSPSWGAWIETALLLATQIARLVAPPRGERGLKHSARGFAAWVLQVAPPRGERGLKPIMLFAWAISCGVAPPRGERGLKHRTGFPRALLLLSLPLVGSVD